MYALIRPLLFRLDPERAHALTLSLVRLAGHLPPVAALLHRTFRGSRLPVRAFGLDFENPVGLAAGYDKDGLGWRGLACLGFGHIEIGTVTLRPQMGNPRPRVFRLPADRALINRMGFPGRGAAFITRHLEGPRTPGLVLGVNIGKNKETTLEDAAQEYLSLVKIFAPLADYLAINISSPNTPGLRALQARAALQDLLYPLQAERVLAQNRLQRALPLLVKLSPDLESTELDDALEVILEAGMDGIIIANTTIRRPHLASSYAAENGGLSGSPLHAINLKMVGDVYRRTQGRLPIIGAGGVMDADGARRYLDAGAVLVQVYTGLIYSGPSLVGTVLNGLGGK